MPSETIDSGVITEDKSARLDAAAHVAAVHFGLDLNKYPSAQIESLLATLPAAVSPADETAVARVLSVCSVGETMFMRHPDQFGALAQIVAEGGVGIPNRPLNVWSAGCSTGEEAYSLAALLAGHPGGARVLGTDVSARSIERAKTGKYRYWSLRGVDPTTTSAWLDIDALHAEVRSPIRNVVDFRVQNLMVDEFPKDIDIIFCRNVLLYFRADSAMAVIQRFYDSMRPNGLLFLGYVDPLPAETTPLVECYHQSVRYYRKPAKGDEIDMPARRSIPPPAPLPNDSSSGSFALPRPPPVPRRSEPPRRLVPRPSEPPPPSAEELAARAKFAELISTARGLCAQGARDEAAELLQSLSIEFPLEIEPHVLTAMVADESGSRDAALAAARRAYFLAPEAPITPFLLAVCLDQVGERNTAEKRYLEARRALDSIKDPLAPLAHAEGLTAYQLRRSIDARFNGS
jgi:chemotaxis protein methyltransferase CheR